MRSTCAMIILPGLALACASCAPLPAPEPLLASCTVTDGDTIRCGDERIRLLAIDAPEMPGHCREGRSCAPGDAFASTRAIKQAIEGQELTIRRMGQDRYDRTLAQVFAGGVDLSCMQVSTGNAVYVRKWDDGRAVASTCPAVP